MSRIVDILMKRDGIGRLEAEEQLLDVRQMVNDAIEDGCYEEVEDIISSELGLEMDYIDEVLGF